MKTEYPVRTGKSGYILFSALAVLSALAFSGCGGGHSGGGPDSGSSQPDGLAIYGIDPDRGPVSGGVLVTITGSGFTQTSTTRVFFGSKPASNVTVEDPGTITCFSPPHPPAVVDVTVTNENGSAILPEAFTVRDQPSILWLKYDQTGNVITLVWSLSSPGDKIEIYRGVQRIATLAGDSRMYVHEESAFGCFRYSVVLEYDGERVDWRDVLVNLGRVTWDPPLSGSYSGFLLYLAEEEELLPYGNPEDFSYNAGMTFEVTFLTLYHEDLIEGKKKYYLAASTFLGYPPGWQLSVLTEPQEFFCEVIMGKP